MHRKTALPNSNPILKLTYHYGFKKPKSTTKWPKFITKYQSTLQRYDLNLTNGYAKLHR